MWLRYKAYNIFFDMFCYFIGALQPANRKFYIWCHGISNYSRNTIRSVLSYHRLSDIAMFQKLFSQISNIRLLIYVLLIFLNIYDSFVGNIKSRKCNVYEAAPDMRYLTKTEHKLSLLVNRQAKLLDTATMNIRIRYK